MPARVKGVDIRIEAAKRAVIVARKPVSMFTSRYTAVLARLTK